MGELPFTDGKFSLNQNQIVKVQMWLKEHAKTCPHLVRLIAGWFGSPLSYTFRPCRSSGAVEVACDCGAKMDLSRID